MNFELLPKKKPNLSIKHIIVPQNVLNFANFSKLEIKFCFLYLSGFGCWEWWELVRKPHKFGSNTTVLKIIRKRKYKGLCCLFCISFLEKEKKRRAFSNGIWIWFRICWNPHQRVEIRKMKTNSYQIWMKIKKSRKAEPNLLEFPPKNSASSHKSTTLELSVTIILIQY